MNKIIKGIIFLFLSLLTLLTSAFTTDFVPIGDVNGRSLYDIKNFVDINATTFYQNGNQVLDTSSSVSANSSIYWIGASSADSEWFYVSSNELILNETHLNSTINALDDDTTYSAGKGLNLSGTTFTFNKSYGDLRYILSSSESNLNVNSSGYWDSLNSPADINAGDITDDGTYVTSETDPVYTADHASHIEATNTSNWNTAFGWGDHASAGYSMKSSNEIISGDKNFTGSILIEEPVVDKNPATKEYVDNATPSESQTLQNVTGEGSTTTDSITVNGLKSNDDIDNGGNILTNTSGILFGAAWDGNTTFIGGAGNGSCDGSTCSIANTGTLDGFEGSDFAQDSAVVHDTGNEVISGDKNFTGRIIFDTEEGNNSVYLTQNGGISSNYVRNYIGSDNQYYLIYNYGNMNYKSGVNGNHDFYINNQLTSRFHVDYVQFLEPVYLNNEPLKEVGDPTVSTDGMSRGYADSRYINTAGDTMTGAFVILEPTADKNPTTKEYVDNITSSLNWSNINGATFPTACPGDTVLIGFNSTDNSAICETDQTGSGSYDLNVTTPSGSGTIEDSEVLTFAESGIIDISMSGNTVTISASSSGGTCPENTECVDAGNYTDLNVTLDGASNGDNIYIPPGIYTGPGMKVFNKEDITITGAGWDQAIFDITDGATALDIKDGKNITISGIRITGSFFRGVELEGIDTGLVEKIKVLSPSGTGIYVNGNENDAEIGTFDYEDTDVTVQYNIVEDYGANGIQGYYNKRTIFEHNQVYCTSLDCHGSGAREVALFMFSPDESRMAYNTIGKFYNSSGTLIGVPEDGIQMHCDGYDLFGTICANNVIAYNYVYGSGRYNEAASILVNHDMINTTVIGNEIFDSGCGSDAQVACVEGSGGQGNGFKMSEGANNTIIKDNIVHSSSGKQFNPGSPSTGIMTGNICMDKEDACITDTVGTIEFKDNYDMQAGAYVRQDLDDIQRITLTDNSTSLDIWYNGSHICIGSESGGSCFK